MNQTSPNSTRVAVLGLGIMGSGMARRLLAAGFPVAVFNRNPSRSAALAAEGAVAAATPRQAAEGADAILSMVLDVEASRAVWLGEDGALAGAKPGGLAIESGTVTLDWIRELDAAVQSRGCELIDAPVTGSKPEANSGDLRFLVGGPEFVFERARPILGAMGKTLIHVGPLGSGARMKLINNFLAATQTTALAEAVAMIERSGIDLEPALEILLAGAPGSPMVKKVSSWMIAPDYDHPHLTPRLFAKDLGYVAKEGRALGVPMSTIPGALEVLKLAIDGGWGDKDIAALIEPYRRKK